jgi:peptidoglycan/LPS O-acetylase OafA/YrhL
MQYSAPLDGIRAIAILAVLMFHVRPSALPGGFTGVDVFFVLSGFLITSIILHDIRDGRFSLKEFYLRRIQRIVPNVVLTVSAIVLLASLVLPPSSARKIGLHGLYTLTNLSNFFIWRNFGGYWGDAAESSPLLHTWSLAVEEQFYLLFPASLILLARFGRARVTRWLLAAAALSFALCVWSTPRLPAAAFYLLPSRVWELLLGGALASYTVPLRDRDAKPSIPAFAARLWEAGARSRFREAIGWIGLCLILAGFFGINEASRFPGPAALLPTIGTTFVIISALRNTRASRLLSSPFMVGTGKLSYSLYLWHWPLITFGKFVAEVHGQRPLAGALAGALASIACAWLAYLLVEQPLRSRGPGRMWRLATIGAGFVAAMAASASVAKAPDIDIARYFDRTEFNGLLYATQASSEMGAAVRFRDVIFPPRDRRINGSWRSGGVIHPFGNGSPKIAVLGSSHALMYSRVIDDACRAMGVSVAFLGADGAVPAFFDAGSGAMTRQEAAEFDQARRNWLREWRPQAVFVIDRWELLDDGAGGFAGQLRTFLAEVSPLAKTVIFVAQPPVIGIGGNAINLREFAAWRMIHDGSFPRLFPNRNEPRRKQESSIAEAARVEFGNLRVLRPDLAFYNADGSVRWLSGRSVLYADDDHLSEAGAELVRELFANAIAGATSLPSQPTGAR